MPWIYFLLLDLEEGAGALSMFSFSTEPMAVLVKRILTRSLPVSRTKVSSLMATTRPMTPPMVVT